MRDRGGERERARAASARAGEDEMFMREDSCLSVPRINIHVTYSSRELGYPGYIHEDNVFTAATCLDTSAKVTRASNSIYPSAPLSRKLHGDIHSGILTVILEKRPKWLL